MWKNVFPEYAVKQALHESDIERGDEHIITAMQSELLSRILISILKGAIINCINCKRKYINEKDIEIGKSFCIFPSKSPPSNAGSLIDSNEFGNLVDDHIHLCIFHVEKNMDIQLEKEYRISQESLNVLQKECESCIRGFVNKLKYHTSVVNFRQFEVLMGNIYGDSSYATFEHGYSPYN